MAYKNDAGLGVKNLYGPSTTREGIAGGVETRGSVKELTFDITGYSINNNLDFIKGLLPKGALVKDVVVSVTEEFTLGGASPAIHIGTKGSEATNGFEIHTDVGTETATPIGTWEESMVEHTDVAVALEGTTPTVTDEGRARVTISYTKL